jgi:hypothetical protein
MAGRVNAKMAKPRNPINRVPSRYSMPSSIPPNPIDVPFFPILPFDGLIIRLDIKTPPSKTMVSDRLRGLRSHCIAKPALGK